jgi:hypothetical protein
VKSPDVERWFANTKPPSEDALRIVRDAILAADKRMTEKVKHGNVMFACGESDFAAFVDVKRSGVNLMLMRGRQLKGAYSHLEGATVRRMLIADARVARTRVGELKAMAREWCELASAASAGAGSSGRSARRSATRPSGGASRSSSR